MNSLRRQFWIKLGVASVTILVFAFTITHSAWIELVFGVDPDKGSGALEWALAAILTLVAVAVILSMRYEWLRAKRLMRSLTNAQALADDSSMPGATNR
ncbi:MAG TPA: hypothetical protein VF725_13585 [Ktedonobacterales bacterium]